MRAMTIGHRPDHVPGALAATAGPRWARRRRVAGGRVRLAGHRLLTHATILADAGAVRGGAPAPGISDGVAPGRRVPRP